MLLRCKACGGNLIIENNNPIATCDYCGAKQTYPHIFEDELIEKYNTANYERTIGNYDAALVMFNDLASRSEKEPDYYWQAFLCRYGIKIQVDPYTNIEKPTLNRTMIQSVYEDPNYKKAIEFSDPSQKYYYEQMAEQIEKIRKQYISISQSEKPYDVFISYKREDANGYETLDTKYAQMLYDELTAKGYNVFFSKKTLKPGDEWEPLIYAALNTSKIFCLIATKEEFANAPWVKNEWSRFLNAMSNDSNKKMTFVYKGNPDYIPSEIKNYLQGEDANHATWCQNITDFVEKYVGKKNGGVVHYSSDGAFSSEDLARNGEINLSLKEYDAALKNYNKLKELYPDDYRGYWGEIKAITHNLTNGQAFLYDKEKIEKLLENSFSLAKTEKESIITEFSEYIKNVVAEIDAQHIFQDLENRKIRLDNRKSKLLEIEKVIRADNNDLYDNIVESETDYCSDNNKSNSAAIKKERRFFDLLILVQTLVTISFILLLPAYEKCFNEYNNFSENDFYIFAGLSILASIVIVFFFSLFKKYLFGEAFGMSFLTLLYMLFIVNKFNPYDGSFYTVVVVLAVILIAVVLLNVFMNMSLKNSYHIIGDKEKKSRIESKYRSENRILQEKIEETDSLIDNISNFENRWNAFVENKERFKGLVCQRLLEECKINNQLDTGMNEQYEEVTKELNQILGETTSYKYEKESNGRITSYILSDIH